MTHDRLRYARESAAALREAHAEIKRLRKAIEEVGLSYIMDNDGNMVVLINCAPGLYARCFHGIKGAYKDHEDAKNAIDKLCSALEKK